MKHYGVSASSFAENIGVQRSSISHILSGRNKPSLDFVLKLVKAYPEVDLYWLLLGKGIFPSEEVPSVPPSTQDYKNDEPLGLFSTSSEEETYSGSKHVPDQKNTDLSIKRIVVFFTDGHFEAYEN